MLEGDFGLGADIRHLCVSGGKEQVRGTAQNLDHNGLLGGAEGLHSLVMGGLRQVLSIDLGKTQDERSDLLLENCWSSFG